MTNYQLVIRAASVIAFVLVDRILIKLDQFGKFKRLACP